jgi:hypothetical protein
MASEHVVARATGLALALAVLALAPAASAQTASDRETARSLMDEAFQRREKGDHKGALERFEAADALMHVPTTGLEAARERIALGMLIEARELLATVARYPTRAGEPAPFGEARMQAQKLDDELGTKIPSLRIVLRGVEGPPSSATVTVDGADVPAATLIAPRRVNPGTHTVVARANGRERREQVTVRERETREILLDLTIATSPATAPVTPAPASSTRADASDTADTSAGERDTGGPSPAPRLMLWGGVALASVGAVVGTVTGVMSLSAVSSAKSGCTDGKLCPPPTYDDIDRARTLGNVSTVAFVAGGVGVVVAVVGYVLGRSDAKESATVGAFVGPNGGGFRGVF